VPVITLKQLLGSDYICVLICSIGSRGYCGRRRRE